MAVDYDALRKTDTDDDIESMGALKERVPKAAGLAADLDDGDAAGGFELDSPEMAESSQDVVVLPVQANEFTCSECFLVRPVQQLDHPTSNGPVCFECAL